MTDDEWDERWSRFLAAHAAPAPEPARLQPWDVAVPLAGVLLAQALVLALVLLG